MDRSCVTIPLAAVVLLALALPVTVQSGRPADALVTASLSAPPTAWDGPVEAVIHFRIDPQWHLYWSNPGDAGLPPAVRWRMPSGFQAGPLRFPTPTKIVADGLVTYGYFGELILVSTITPPAGYRPDERDSIHADIEWLACKESCLPGSTMLALPCAGSGNPNTAALQLMDRFTHGAPLPWHGTGEGIPFVTASDSGGALLLTFDPRMRVDDFYPNIVENAVVDHASIRVEARRVSLRVHPSGPGVVINRLHGIMIAGRNAYSVDLPVRYQN